MSEVKKSSTPKSSGAKNSTKSKDAKSSNSFAKLVVPISLLVAFLLFYLVFRNQFDENGHPKNFMGQMYEGGVVVPFLMATLFVCIAIVIERFRFIFAARGKFSGQELVRKVQYNLANKNIDGAIAECDKQQGSVGNVLRSGLVMYKNMMNNDGLNTEQKVMAISNEVEETEALEMPMLEQNLVFLSTIASVATLIGLFGTVLGMIRAFAAMSNAGAPDAGALAAGISEALINTALGIGTSAIAIIAYNVLTTQIDSITYAIDESKMTLTQSFAANYK